MKNKIKSIALGVGITAFFVLAMGANSIVDYVFSLFK